MATSSSHGVSVVGNACASIECGQQRLPVISAGGVWLNRGNSISEVSSVGDNVSSTASLATGISSSIGLVSSISIFGNKLGLITRCIVDGL